MAEWVNNSHADQTIMMSILLTMRHILRSFNFCLFFTNQIQQIGVVFLHGFVENYSSMVLLFGAVNAVELRYSAIAEQTDFAEAYMRLNYRLLSPQRMGEPLARKNQSKIECVRCNKVGFVIVSLYAHRVSG